MTGRMLSENQERALELKKTSSGIPPGVEETSC